MLLDEDSFHEIGLLADGSIETPGKSAQQLPADGVVPGWGTTHGRHVCVVADDGTLVGGAASLQNIAKRLLKHLEDQTVAQGIPLLRLETGIYQTAAITLYEQSGFYRIGPFGEYRDDPLSRYYEKRLAWPPVKRAYAAVPRSFLCTAPTLQGPARTCGGVFSHFSLWASSPWVVGFCYRPSSPGVRFSPNLLVPSANRGPA